MMKDIMQKLAELEATAPKFTKKKMLNEDSTTPPMNVSNKIASLKDMFEALSESIPAGAKPLPVLDPQNKQAGMGFVTSNNPAVQNMLKALDPKDVQIVQAPGQQPQAPAAGQPAQAGATGQPQAGQMQMKEKDEGKPGKNFAKIAKSAGKRYGSKEAGERVAGAVRAKLAAQGKLEEEQLDELSPETLRSYATKSKERWSDLSRDYEPTGTPRMGRDVTTSPSKSAQRVGARDIEAGDYSMSKKTAPVAAPVNAEKRKRYQGVTQAWNKLGNPTDVADPSAKWDSSKGPSVTKSDRASVKVLAREGAKVDRMVKHIEKSEKKLGKSKGEAEDIAWATANKRGMLDNKNKKKVKEGDIPSSSGVDTKGAGLGAGRSATTLESKEPQVEVIDNAFNRENYKDLIGKKYPKSKAPSYARVKEVTEGKKGVNPFPKKDDNASTKAPAKGKKPDFLDLDKDGNKKEPMKKAAADKKKKKVDESMNHRISAARLEGKSHGLRGHAHSGKRYEDLEEMKAYHEGYKEGLDECYGQGVYETAMPATVPGMASQALDEIGDTPAGKKALASYVGKRAKDMSFDNDEFISDLSLGDGNVWDKYDKGMTGIQRAAKRLSNEDEMEEGNAFTAALAKTPKGGKFAVGGKTFTDRTGYDAKVNEYAFESLDQQLNALLNESEEVSEGLSVSISKGQQNSPDSVTITAQDAEAEHLLAFVKNAGLGLFGDDNADTQSSAMSVQPSHGAPDEVGAGGIDIGVVDGHDGMMGLMQKLSGIQSVGADDYADEEGDEEHLYGNHETADKKDCGCDGDCECSDYDQPANEATCNECGTYEGMHEAGCSMGSGKEMVDEVESEDQMEFEVAEDNAPDSGEAESTADENAEAAEDMALAKAGSKGGTYTVNEDGDEASEEGPESKEGEGDEGAETVSESFANLFRKLSFIAEESTEKEDDKAEKAGKKVAKDIEHDEGHTGKDDDKAEKAGKKVTKDIEYDDKKDKKEKVDEWANNAGPGKTVSDTTFEQDIDFMTKVIAGGLNKPKSTGQTTIPVIAGQDDRMHDNPMDWATLAGIKK
jgi:hypothetical protein